MGLISAAKRGQRRRPLGAETLTGGSVQVGGETIYYQAAGSAEEGPTILFLHESGGSVETWHRQLAGLAAGSRCLVVDLPGHGRSEGLGYLRVGEYRRAVLGFLDALAIRWPVVLAGVCLGAAVAVDIALHAPERVAGLVLAGVSEGGRAPQGWREAAAVGEEAEEFVTGLFGPYASEQLRHARLRRWRLTSPLVRYADLTAVYSYPLTTSMVAVQQPVLIVAGMEDATATPALAMALAAGMADARVEALPKAGCLAMLEQPIAFNRAMSNFLVEMGTDSPIGPEVRQSGGYRRF